MDGPRVIVALDYATAGEALEFTARVRPEWCRLKVGLELFTAAGPGIVAALVERGFDVFLDLKYHDIPNTVARSCIQAAGLGVWMLNVHTLGGPEMLRAARAAVDSGSNRPLLIGVTLLSSHSGEEISMLGFKDSVRRQVDRLAELARTCGLDGVVCAPTEVGQLRQRFGPRFTLVTPGIRPPGSAAEDQRRVATPQEAVRRGADYLVIGRPITRATDPVAELEQINRALGD